MPTKVRLAGSTSRVVRIRSTSAPREIVVVFATGEDLPTGDLYATATNGDDTVNMDVFDATGSDGIVTVIATIDPNDFEAYGPRVWRLEVGVLDEGSGGSGDDAAYVMFAGSVVFEQVIAKVIASTTIQEAAS